MVDTLIIVAIIDSLIMNLEKDFCWLKAMRRAMREEMFTIKNTVYTACSILDDVF
jgi:hypothetical protein